MSVAVYERDRGPTDRPEGYRIHLNPAGSRALHACLPPQVWDSFVATAGEPGGLGFLTEQLRELVVITDVPSADPAQGSHAVDRITLRQLLLSGLDGSVHFGKTSMNMIVARSVLPVHVGLRAPLRACGQAAVRTALRTQRQGLRSNRVAVTGTRAWFRACNTIPPLRALSLPYRSQARPRVWETSPNHHLGGR